MAFEVGTIDFALYEDSTEFVGMTSLTLPNKNRKVITINGAGTGGDIEVPIPGLYDAMELTLSVRGDSKRIAMLREPRRHQLELRVAQTNEDPAAGILIEAGFKHVLVGVPKSMSGGTIAPGTSGDASVTFAIRYWATYLNGEKLDEFDPLNRIDIVNGIDYSAGIRKILGK